MFNALNEKLQSVFKGLRGQARITDENIQGAVKQVRMALLEADVNFKVVKRFVTRVSERALGEAVLGSVSPAQQFIKVVHDELVVMLGGEDGHAGIPLAPNPPTVIMMAGLQGSGKTTSAGKLARRFINDGRSVLLVAGDIYRPAAIDQLERLSGQLKTHFFAERGQKNAVKVAKHGMSEAKRLAVDVVIFDTAGRLHVDDELMKELVATRDAVKPHEILFVADAMTGQDAVGVAESFDEALGITGIVLTKLDGDARGGAALSIRDVTGRPVKFVGVGEKLDDFEPFHPDRMASRILGMGDVVTLVEKAQDAIEEDEAEALAKKGMKGSLDFNDLLQQFKMLKKMGSMESLMKMIPGMGNMMQNTNVDEGQLTRTQAMILSMTPAERADARLLNGSRKKRIARGSGSSVQDVNKLVAQLQQMNKMMKKMSKRMGGGKKADPSMLKDMFPKF